MGPPLEELQGTEEEREQAFIANLQEAASGSQHDQKLALVLKISHIGGHKYAGKDLSRLC
jgi:hypothetical protein